MNNYWQNIKRNVNPAADEKAGTHGKEIIKYLNGDDQELRDNEGSNVPGWYRKRPGSCWIGPYLTSTEAFNRVMY